MQQIQMAVKQADEETVVQDIAPGEVVLRERRNDLDQPTQVYNITLVHSYGHVYVHFTSLYIYIILTYYYLYSVTITVLSTRIFISLLLYYFPLYFIALFYFILSMYIAMTCRKIPYVQYHSEIPVDDRIKLFTIILH